MPTAAGTFTPATDWNGTVPQVSLAYDYRWCSDIVKHAYDYRDACERCPPVATADNFNGASGTPIIITQAQLLATMTSFCVTTRRLPEPVRERRYAGSSNGNGTYNFHASAAGTGSF